MIIQVMSTPMEIKKGFSRLIVPLKIHRLGKINVKQNIIKTLTVKNLIPNTIFKTKNYTFHLSIRTPIHSSAMLTFNHMFH